MAEEKQTPDKPATVRVQDGRVETTMAIPADQTTDQRVPLQKGKTEAPQAVAKPITKPPQGGKGNSGKK